MSDQGSKYSKAELLRALKNNELVIHYQPQYNLSTCKFEGVEALLRWQHAEKGLLLPHDFFPHHKDTSFLIHIGEWVIKNAVWQNRDWQKKGLAPIRVAVNVLREQFQQRDFVEFIASVLSESRLKPHHLELELTENSIIDLDDKKTLQKIQRLRNLGVHITLDDFGKGYSSISHLKTLPLNTIKIDKSYILNIDNEKRDAAIVKAIAALGESLEIDVLAEGVETYEQLAKLEELEKIKVQGFYFCKPLPADEVEVFLSEYANKKFPIVR